MYLSVFSLRKKHTQPFEFELSFIILQSLLMPKPTLLLTWSRNKPVETLIILRPEILPEMSGFCKVAADQLDLKVD